MMNKTEHVVQTIGRDRLKEVKMMSKESRLFMYKILMRFNYIELGSVRAYTTWHSYDSFLCIIQFASKKIVMEFKILDTHYEKEKRFLLTININERFCLAINVKYDKETNRIYDKYKRCLTCLLIDSLKRYSIMSTIYITPELQILL